jgi:hypothetical protein
MPNVHQENEDTVTGPVLQFDPIKKMKLRDSQSAALRPLYVCLQGQKDQMEGWRNGGHARFARIATSFSERDGVYS